MRLRYRPYIPRGSSPKLRNMDDIMAEYRRAWSSSYGSGNNKYKVEYPSYSGIRSQRVEYNSREPVVQLGERERQEQKQELKVEPQAPKVETTIQTTEKTETPIAKKEKPRVERPAEYYDMVEMGW
ncbi:MAG: hypothetical protein MN733_32775 [Nitrososphaera sp.]|nr:hypothetical protein [Nitrososphaera sp.]